MEIKAQFAHKGPKNSHLDMIHEHFFKSLHKDTKQGITETFSCNECSCILVLKTINHFILQGLSNTGLIRYITTFLIHLK